MLKPFVAPVTFGPDCARRARTHAIAEREAEIQALADAGHVLLAEHLRHAPLAVDLPREVAAAPCI